MIASVYIKNHCVEVSSRWCLRSSSHRCLIISPPSNTVLFGERSFMVRGPSLWNHLLDNVKEAGSIELLKQRLNPLDAGIRSTDFAPTPYAAGSLLTDGTVYECSGW